MNAIIVHGDIRHLEKRLLIKSIWCSCSWRHTPLRNNIVF
ncbi:hypothetical protein J500_2842 [Acinetobacter sp. 479375]|nr:hypothetical protein J500_3542 [Acinetobacter sp. 479375]EXD33153.1 hypothetical protein J500_2842 [Acinetobacter sp. 479375]